MSQLERGQPLVGVQRNVAQPVRTEQGTVPLQAPGIVAMPPVVTKGMRDAQSLMQIIGGVGQVAGQIGQIRRQDEADQRRTEAEKKRDADELRVYERGQASRGYRLEFVRQGELIANDDESWELGEGQTYEELVDGFIAGQTEGASEDYATEYSNLKPQLLGMLNRRQAIRQEKAESELNKLFSDGIRTPGEGKSLEDIRSYQKNHDLSDVEVVAKLIVPAMQGNDDKDSVDRLDKLATEFVGEDGFRGERETIKDAIQAGIIQDGRMAVEEERLKILDAEGPRAEILAADEAFHDGKIPPRLHQQMVANARKVIDEEYDKQQVAHITNDTKPADDMRKDWARRMDLPKDDIDYMTEYRQSLLESQLKQRESAAARQAEREFIDQEIGKLHKVSMNDKGEVLYDGKTMEQKKAEWLTAGIPNAKIEELSRRFVQQHEEDMARRRVKARMGGNTSISIDHKADMTAINEEIREVVYQAEDGTIRPAINDANQIESEEALAIAVLSVGEVWPTELKGIVYDGLRTGSRPQLDKTVGLLRLVKSLRQQEDIIKSAGDDVRPMILEAYATSGSKLPHEISMIKVLSARDTPLAPPSSYAGMEAQLLVDYNVDVNELLPDFYDAVRKAQFPYLWFSNDADLQPGGDRIDSAMRGWFMERFYQAMNNKGMTVDSATELATQSVTANLRNTVDFIPLHGTMRWQSLTSGNNVRVGEQMRTSPAMMANMEDEIVTLYGQEMWDNVGGIFPDPTDMGIVGQGEQVTMPEPAPPTGMAGIVDKLGVDAGDLFRASANPALGGSMLINKIAKHAIFGKEREKSTPWPAGKRPIGRYLFTTMDGELATTTVNGKKVLITYIPSQSMSIENAQYQQLVDLRLLSEEWRMTRRRGVEAAVGMDMFPLASPLKWTGTPHDKPRNWGAPYSQGEGPD